MTNPIDRLPPQNTDAEEAVLGSCLMDPEAIRTAAPILAEADFYRERHGHIYAAMLSICRHGEQVDFLTVSDALTKAGNLEEVGGISYLSHLYSMVPTALAVEHYARIVGQAAVRRRLISDAGKMAAAAYDEATDLDELRQRALSLVTQTLGRDPKSRVLTPPDLQLELSDMLLDLSERQSVGLATGFTDLDTLIGGFQPGQLVVLVADTSLGKSSWALSLARRVGRAGHASLFCSVEMSERQLIARLASAMSGVSWRQIAYQTAHGIKDERVTTAVGKASVEIESCGIHVYYKPGLRVADVQAIGSEWRVKHSIELVIVDYLQIMTPANPRDGRVQQVSLLTRELKRLAGELTVPMVVLCQLNRQLTGRSDKRPTLHDARESGSVEQDADMLMGLYRDDFYFDPRENHKVVPGKAELLVLKHRDGPTGTLNLKWIPATAEYDDWR